ncbi:DNA methyltransferase [Lactiplantibacillus plantarum]|uniref:DNA methyltransferase n=1 Tax=Lactiplantibacillus plantarum TaxID=1590 RepID=UPI0018AD3531|nr:DNA methyltransferase [Lactiplantibacillus plantarum]MBS0939841.1 site-specific DNA-methyltransferase [Lactiplantibacillus plantarum]WGF85471.1 DNA methyltransferase [Lactiplantibacillus plantarum]WGG42796.1 DNA methyltransferase [Lactiplantibacillus plantarum]
MSKIEPRLFDELKKVLVSFGGKYFIGDELNRSKVSDDLRAYDEALLAKLFEIDFIKKNYIKEVAGQKLFQIDQLEEAILYDDYWDTSYTKYENRVGLTTNGKFIEDNQDVVLDFPFKDGVLTASMTKEDNENGYDDAFLNEVIEKDEIDRLFDKKILNNVKRYDVDGEKDTDCFDTEKDNLIIKGNNLLALHTLADKYASRIKMIYVDVPYYFKKKISEDSFKYNSNFHLSAWLTFLKNRLEIAKQLMSENGSIWINISEDGMHYLKVMADAVFGKEKFVGTIPRKTRNGKSDVTYNMSQDFDWLLVYTNGNEKDAIVGRTVERQYYNTPDFPNRPWRKADLTKQTTIAQRPNSNFTMINPKSGKKYPVNPKRSWAVTEETFDEWYKNGGIGFPDDYEFMSGDKPFRRVFKDEDDARSKPSAVYSDFLLKLFSGGTVNKLGNDQIDNLFNRDSFDYAKPEQLLAEIIKITTNKNDIVLDFFMGSATTQAVAMKMNRRFIGIEQMDYINTVSVPRLQKVIDGEQGGISKDVNWQGGGSFVYAELMSKNMGYLQDLISSKKIDELHEVYNRMLSGVEGSQEPADISFKADLDKIEWDATKVKFEDQKRLLVKLLDKNGLYYNYSEIDDQNVREFLSDSDYQFNKDFYGTGE